MKGKVSKAAREFSERHFADLPRQFQIGVWSSEQDKVTVSLSLTPYHVHHSPITHTHPPTLTHPPSLTHPHSPLPTSLTLTHSLTPLTLTHPYSLTPLTLTHYLTAHPYPRSHFFQPISSVQVLDEEYARNEERFGSAHVFCPPYYHAYLLHPYSYEFYDGGDIMIHNLRMRFTKNSALKNSSGVEAGHGNENETEAGLWMKTMLSP